MKNHIIIEGLWGLGKNSVIRELASRKRYLILPEPSHLTAPAILPATNLTAWYLRQHRKRERMLNLAPTPTILERSSLSTFAYAYACHGILPTQTQINPIRNLIASRKVLLIYLTAPRPRAGISFRKLHQPLHGPHIQSLLRDPRAVKRYEAWYQEILPFVYGILPFQINVLRDGKRRIVADIVGDILACQTHNRIGQVNVVVCHRFGKQIQALILKRTIPRGGFWQSVTGGIHIGEPPMEAAIRELTEELSLPLSLTHVLPTNFSYSFMGNNGYPLNEFVFAVILSKPLLIRLSGEHDRYEWLSPLLAKNRVKYAGNKKAITVAIESIKKAANP